MIDERVIVDKQNNEQHFTQYIVEFLKVIYVQIYRRVYWFLSLFIKHKKYDVVIIAKHSNNIFNYLKLYPNETLAVITDNKLFENKLTNNKKLKKKIWYSEYSLFSMIKQITMILQTSKIVIDDYYPPLFALDASKEVWNIWHSYAVYKKIGLDSPLYAERSKLALSRYRRNYKRIDKLFVRSKMEQEIFAHSYNISQNKIIVKPAFYKSPYQNFVPEKKAKKVIYAPTFRPYKYDFDRVYQKIKEHFDGYEVVASFHPKTLQKQPDLHKIHTKSAIPELLKTAEFFVTDYSGLLIEVAELCKDIKVCQVIESAEYQKYKMIVGLNDDKYDKNYQELIIE